MLPSHLPTRVLIVEDDEDDYLLIEACIKDIPDKKFLIDWCYNYEEALKRIADSGYDIYFIDYLLGEKTGLELLRDAVALGCEDPLVLLTGIGNRDVDIQAMTIGAVDFLIKSEINTEKLERCIRYALERSTHIRALKANERKFRNIFERSKDAVFLADGDLVFRDANNATSDLFKYGRDELQQLSLYFLFARRDAAALLKARLQQTGEVEDEEVELMTRTKEKRNCILSLSRQTDPAGDTYIQGIIHDITNLKRIERATFQIEKLRSTATLLRTLAHEVRNPLTNINLSVEQLKPELNSEDANIYLDIIARNCGRIDGLISELLDLSRPAEISLQRVPLQSIVDSTLAAASDRISLKGIGMELNYPEHPAYIMADMEKLKIAFLNIVINAVEAVPNQAGRINVTIREDGGHYKVFINDNGSGIPEENISRIFEPYFTSKTNGFGLGLAATWNILQSHRATIDVNSQIGEGTSFVLAFETAN
ncbi:MAG: hybrid sensor histidine kinase/response regulator [Sphingobacteriales bacterium 50-39]|nr:PAS domain S-box protein [Sphingobacteriales bacterium]OJW55040.1 MAG: hybrid sensor histidine kinase/response regulator [Sphingobacteriales bacterium 50-39]